MCGLSTSAGNLLTFFFTVCNNRSVRVIGRVGKRPEITVLYLKFHFFLTSLKDVNFPDNPNETLFTFSLIMKIIFLTF